MKKMDNKLHLGCGSNYLEGWVNIDISFKVKTDLCQDLTKRLPYLDNSINFIFNEHFIEHIDFYDAIKFLKECYRVLKPNGILRISTPDLKWLVLKYLEGKIDEWNDVKWYPLTKCAMLNQGMKLWGHQYLYDFEELTFILNSVSFYKIERVLRGKSKYQELNMLESRPYHNEIIVEVTK
jgi:predicted SAM-dependent methyltransferase